MSKTAKAQKYRNLMDDTLVRTGLKTITRQIVNDPHNKSRNRREFTRLNGLRKFAVTQMSKSRMEAEIHEKLIGHSGGIANTTYDTARRKGCRNTSRRRFTHNKPREQTKLKVDELESKQHEIELMKVEMKNRWI
jgi:hypothetical protein